MAIAAVRARVAVLTPMRPSRRREIAALVAVVAALALLGQRAWRIDYDYSIDFQTYWLAGSRVLEGRAAELYAPGGGSSHGTPVAMGAREFKNIPLVAVAFVPLAVFEYETAKRVAWWLALAAVAVTAWIVGRFLMPEGLGSEPARVGLALAALAAMAPTHIALRHGQTTPFVTLALAGYLACLVRGKPGRAGGLLALACLVKFPPLALVPLDALRGRRRAALACAAGLLVAGTLSLVAFGPKLHRAYAAEIAAQAGTVITGHNNQSLAAMATRLWEGGGTNDWTPRPLSPVPKAIAGAVAALLLALVVAGTWVPRDGGRVTLEATAALAWGLLVLPIAWDHYVLMLAPGFIGLTAHLAATSDRGRAAGLAAAALAFALLALPTPRAAIESGASVGLPGALVLSHYGLGAIAVLALAVVTLRRASAETAVAV